MKEMGKKYSGFVLMEMMVALFIFALMITTIVGVFIAAYKSQQVSKISQQDMENVRVAMENMAKNIRMSTLDEGDGDELYIYNYSQGKCIGYKIENHPEDSSKKTLEFSEARINRLDLDGNLNNCRTILFNTEFSSLISSSQLSYAQFTVQKTGPTQAGKVTTVFTLDSNSTTFETSVSLRDYN